MKKALKKVVCLGLLIVSSTAVLPAYAAEAESAVCSQATGDTAMPCADVIVYKTRLYNGVQQYRRWNQTKGYWVDPEWINL